MVAARYIYFTHNMAGMCAFYRDVLGLKVKSAPDAMDYASAQWLQLATGTFEVALHKAGKPGLTGKSRNKLVFFAKDVEKARKDLKAKGVKAGEIYGSDDVQLCDFKDPDGNVLQISNR